MSTTWIDRLTDALETLCLWRPPAEIVDSWLNSDSEALQDWVGMNARPQIRRHTMSIAIIEAAMLMADQPVEGEGHEIRTDAGKGGETK